MDDVARLMAGAHLLVMPSECLEGAVPLVIPEAMSLGVPVVMSRFGAADDFFRDGQNAFLFTPGSEGELRGAVERAQRDNALRNSVAAEGRSTYLKEFNPERNLSLLKGIYEQILAGRTA